jgi:hypothetical protein
MPEKQWNLYSIIHGIVGDDVGMVFGPTGTGKSMLLRATIQSAILQDVKVAMCDTETNYIQEDIDWLEKNTEYKRMSKLKGIIDWAEGLKKGFKFLAVDSLGGPAYGEWVRAGMGKQSLDIFKNMARAGFAVQQYCRDNNAMAILINQPTSEFGAKDSKEQEPFGGKSNFYWKEVMKTVYVERKAGSSIMRLDAYKSRHFAPDHVIGQIGISNKRVVLMFAPYLGRRIDCWPETRCEVPNPGMEEPEKSEKQVPPDGSDAPEMEIEEDDDSGEGFGDGGDELKALLNEIRTMMTEKEISTIQFAALMKSKNIGVEHLEQINDLDTAEKVKSCLVSFGSQKDKNDGEMF